MCFEFKSNNDECSSSNFNVSGSGNYNVALSKRVAEMNRYLITSGVGAGTFQRIAHLKL